MQTFLGTFAKLMPVRGIMTGMGTFLLAACASTASHGEQRTREADYRLFTKTWEYCRASGADQNSYMPGVSRDPQIHACMEDFGWYETSPNRPWRYQPLPTSRQLPE